MRPTVRELNRCSALRAGRSTSGSPSVSCVCDDTSDARRDGPLRASAEHTHSKVFATLMTETQLRNSYLESGSRSSDLFRRAAKVMPGGNSRTTVFTAPYPAYIASAQGAVLTDVEGQTRLDFVNNYTSLIHGHAHPQIVEAIRQQLALGTAFSFPTESEV